MMGLVISQEKSGVLSRILIWNDKALNVHCFNHRFNLMIANSCNFQKVQNLMGVIKELSCVFKSKREQFLKNNFI